LNLRRKLKKSYGWSTAFYGSKILALRKIDQTYYEGLEIGCWRRTQKIDWTDCAK
jgi:ABC-type polysaccharide transport system permease subunit